MWGTGPGPRGVGFAELCPCPCAQDTVKGFVVELEQQISQLQQHREKQEAVVKQLQGEHQGTVPDTWTQWAFPPPSPPQRPLSIPWPTLTPSPPAENNRALQEEVAQQKEQLKEVERLR